MKTAYSKKKHEPKLHYAIHINMRWSGLENAKHELEKFKAIAWVANLQHQPTPCYPILFKTIWIQMNENNWISNAKSIIGCLQTEKDQGVSRWLDDIHNAKSIIGYLHLFLYWRRIINILFLSPLWKNLSSCKQKFKKDKANLGPFTKCLPG